jgi:hypothetical protein
MALIPFLLSWPYYLVDLNRFTNPSVSVIAASESDDGRHHECDAD